MKLRSVLAFVSLLLCVGCFVLVTDGATEMLGVDRTLRRRVEQPVTSTVLMIGDSLSAGPFGRAVQAHLEARHHRVAAYASCGSSPEHWLAEEPSFETHCGYRESTSPGTETLLDFVNGRRPAAHNTPKLETLLRRHQPNIVIIQLGTNWMDRNLTPERMNDVLDRLMRTAAQNRRRVIWVTPPDSAAFARVQAKYQALIKAAARRNGVAIVDSSRMTQYERGKTGGDGIHYNTASSIAWAEKVNRSLDETLSRGGPHLATQLHEEAMQNVVSELR